MADQAYTLNTVNAKGVQVLTAEATRQTGYTHLFRILYSDINGTAAQGDTVTVTLANTPTNFAVLDAGMYVSTAFDVSTGTPTITASVGTASDLDALIEAASIKDAGWVSGQVALTDSSTGTASNTLAAITSTEPANLAAVGTQLVVIKNAIASLAAKINLLAKATPVIVGTSSTTLKTRLTFQNASGGDPDLLDQGELYIWIRMIDLDAVG